MAKRYRRDRESKKSRGKRKREARIDRRERKQGKTSVDQKEKKKPEKKSSIKPGRTKIRFNARDIAVIIIVIVIIVSCLTYTYFYYFSQTPGEEPEPTFIIGDPSSPYKVAIIDYPGISSSNQNFVEESIDIFENAGYTIYYYDSTRVNVELYRNLPTHDYDIILLRVHSSRRTPAGKPESLSLFTSEKYTKSKYVNEQLNDEVTCVAFNEGGTSYFGITEDFVKSCMKGRFNNTKIIMMGCSGLSATKMAEAFIEKGADAYIGWQGSISLDHSDKATLYLLDQLINKEQTIHDGLKNTMLEIGPDPIYDVPLFYYPEEAKEQVISIDTRSTDYLTTETQSEEYLEIEVL